MGTVECECEDYDYAFAFEVFLNAYNRIGTDKKVIVAMGITRPHMDAMNGEDFHPSMVVIDVFENTKEQRAELENRNVKIYDCEASYPDEGVAWNGILLTKLLEKQPGKMQKLEYRKGAKPPTLA